MAGGEFGVARLAAEGGEVQVADDVLVGLWFAIGGFEGEQRGDAAGGVAEFVGEDVAVERVQGLGEVLVGGAFAFADAGTLRFREDVQEVIGVLSIGQFDRFCAERQVFEFRLRAGGAVDRIQQRFGREAFDSVVGVEAAVAGVRRGRL